MPNEPDVEVEYRKGLALVQKYGPYVIQKRSEDGTWVNLSPRGSIRGLEAGKKYLREYLESHEEVDPHDLRCVPKIVSDTIQETLNVLREQGKIPKEEKEEVAPKRRPRIYLPDNL